MQKYVKWILLAGGALLVLGMAKRTRDTGAGAADAPGVRITGDVPYAAYQYEWTAARKSNKPNFSRPGRKRTNSGQWYWYTWAASDGSLVSAVLRGG